MPRIRAAIAINFFVASGLMLLAIVYAQQKGIPIDKVCMGFHSSARSMRAPAWVAPITIQSITLAAFLLLRSFPPESGLYKMRLWLGLLSAMFVFGVWFLPKMAPANSVWSGGDQSYGILIWLYAGLANILLAIGGPWDAEE